MNNGIYDLLEQALLSDCPDEKGRLTEAAFELSRRNGFQPEAAGRPLDFRVAGRPPKPLLVAPSQVTPRKMNTVEGYAAMLHAITHIEFNAVNLALDAAYRFRRLPAAFVQDWIRVAKEEVYHFRLMRERLRSLGFDYGDFEAHNHLWDMAYKTAYDPLLRMALVPRVLEARGLDVTPAIRAKVAQKGDQETCSVLDIIYRDEIGHVETGNRWYQHLCQERGLEPVALFRRLIARYDMFIFRGYVNIEARERAGFSRFELDMLEDFEKSLKQGKTGN
ncbi:ferritin-like domain-containing protein [Neisseria sp. ZJ106]|uniref:Ferritin-like domain-containing protein n=1 Tax=Neisseria lisongii TaxID=2912188 RepID=A0ABY7RJY3_9NEIS|nr:ferritin-like domain-containing protein [Neisseria lisongii]MCF7521401.1 ferritin-like domain-containing protein [Neisseria lisongii]WCL71925.1 ferritin-like domain-containing protein [Neisseria lisongii]